MCITERAKLSANVHVHQSLAQTLLFFITSFFRLIVFDLIAAAASESEANERGSSLIGKGLLYGACNHFFYQTQRIVVDGKIKGAKNCAVVSANGRFTMRSGVQCDPRDPRANAASLICALLVTK